MSLSCEAINVNDALQVHRLQIEKLRAELLKLPRICSPNSDPSPHTAIGFSEVCRSSGKDAGGEHKSKHKHKKEKKDKKEKNSRSSKREKVSIDQTADEPQFGLYCDPTLGKHQYGRGSRNGHVLEYLDDIELLKYVLSFKKDHDNLVCSVRRAVTWRKHQHELVTRAQDSITAQHADPQCESPHCGESRAPPLSVNQGDAAASPSLCLHSGCGLAAGGKDRRRRRSSFGVVEAQEDDATSLAAEVGDTHSSPTAVAPSRRRSIHRAHKAHLPAHVAPYEAVIRRLLPAASHKAILSGEPIVVARLGISNIGMLMEVVPANILIDFIVFSNEVEWWYCNKKTRSTGRLFKCYRIIDMKGVSSKMIDKRFLKVFSEVSQMSEVLHPQLVAKTILVNPPSFIRWMIEALKFLGVSKRSLEKIHVVQGSSSQSDELMTLVRVESLPTFLGGECDCTELHKGDHAWGDGACLPQWPNRLSASHVQAMYTKERASATKAALEEIAKSFEENDLARIASIELKSSDGSTGARQSEDEDLEALMDTLKRSGAQFGDGGASNAARKSFATAKSSSPSQQSSSSSDDDLEY